MKINSSVKVYATQKKSFLNYIKITNYSSARLIDNNNNKDEEK